MYTVDALRSVMAETKQMSDEAVAVSEALSQRKPQTAQLLAVNQQTESVLPVSQRTDAPIAYGASLLPKKPKKKPLLKHWQFWLGIALAVLLFAGGVLGLFYLGYASRHVAMPDLAGVAPYEAGQQMAGISEDWKISYLTSDGIPVSIIKESDYEGWEVVSQEPSAGTVLEIESPEQQVTLTIQLTEKYKAERTAIIDNYIKGQQINFGWPDNSISAFDYGDLVVIKFFSTWNSHDGVSTDGSGAQVEADMLATNLKSNVLIFSYTSDYYLKRVNGGLYADIPDGVNERTVAVSAEMMASADEYAIGNRKAWLGSFCASAARVLINNGDRTAFSWVDYDILEDEIVIAYRHAPNTYFSDYDQSVGYYQYIAYECALFLRSNVTIIIYDDYSDEIELSVTSAKPSYIYNKNSSS
jgi:hypothetical protein